MIHTRRPPANDTGKGVHVPHSFWLFSLHSEACPLIDRFVRWYVIIGVVSILQAPEQLTLVTLILWSLLGILCLTASSACSPQAFGNNSDWVRWLLPPSSPRLSFLREIFLWGFFFLKELFYIRCLTARNSIKKRNLPLNTKTLLNGEGDSTDLEQMLSLNHPSSL